MEDSKKEKIKQDFLRLHIAKRTMVYIVRTILIVMVTFLLCALAFFTSERISNLYILASEGMSARAAVVFSKETDRSVLEEYFLPSCLARDEWLATDAYSNYTISSYSCNLDVKKVSVLPWSSTATLTAIEEVSVKGTVMTDKIEEGKTASDYPLPKWRGGKYEIDFVNDGERWYISDLKLLEEDPQEKPLNTPDLSKSILPMATPTPTAEVYDLW
ncbi:MAG: hypothetical protein IJJ92_06045 [Clostridia bacterium]|nr:hypothetical protein [Clostridia bacterium]